MSKEGTSGMEVTISKARQIHFNQRVTSDVIGDRTHCELYYDADFRRIGFRFTDGGKLHEYKLTRNKGYAVVHGGSFFRFYQIPVLATTRYPATLMKSGEMQGMLVVGLKEGTKKVVEEGIVKHVDPRHPSATLPVMTIPEAASRFGGGFNGGVR
jgi:hypothetical protein